VRIDVLFLAWNRLRFTKMSFNCLYENTDWSLIDRLVVYDDGSEDGTREWLDKQLPRIPVSAAEVRHAGWNSPAAIMNDYVALAESDYFMKVDNDVCLPANWLEPALCAVDKYPGIDLFGMEVGMSGNFPEPVHCQDIINARHIGGIGLMKTHAFIVNRGISSSLGKHRRDGFTIWQYRNPVIAAWLTPDPMVVQLDRIPDDPWASMTREYIEKGWNREWGPYEERDRLWWSWLPDEVEELAER
jgi:glycosyltransferase involved in cell wall biosynthesis